MPNGHVMLHGEHILERIQMFAAECDDTTLERETILARRALATVETYDRKGAAARRMLPHLRQAVAAVKKAALAPRPKPPA